MRARDGVSALRRAEIVFDPAKDEANRAKHGLSLKRVLDLTDIRFVADNRFEEPRFRLYGWIEGQSYCAAVTMRGDLVRVISFRRAHAKEMRRHGY